MQDGMLALALRSTLYKPSEVLEFAGLADSSRKFQALFFPDITGGYDSIELSMAALAMTRDIRAGSGVLRPLEHNVEVLARRLGTLQFLSNNRFILGVGTGKPTSDPGETISRVVGTVEQVRERFEREFKNRRLEMPEVFMAALRSGIARRTIQHVDGLILNFCSADYAAGLVKDLRSKGGAETLEDKTIACYLKIFYSADENVARRLLLSEFKHYDENPQYHQMFEKERIAKEIQRAWERKAGDIPERLGRISMANPSVDELRKLVEDFRSAGVDLPCLYPYFDSSDDAAFKLGVIEDLVSLE